MSIFQFVATDNAGDYAPGDDVPLHHTVSLFGSLQASDIETVEVTIYRLASDESRIIAEDRNGTTIDKVQVTGTDGDPSTFLFVFESQDTQATGTYFAEWEVTLPGLNLEHDIDRFTITQPLANRGDVEFEKPRTPAT